MTDITSITTRFGKAYERNKKAKSWLEKQQKGLFQAFDIDLSKQTLGQRSVEVPEGLNPEEYVKLHHPGWQIIGLVGGTPNVILEENPSLLSHTYINHEDGMVYGRDKVTGTPSLDDDRLRAEDPDLWERITEWPEPWWSLVRNIFVESFPRWNTDVLDSVTIEHLTNRGVLKVIRDLNTFTPYDLALIERYIIPGPVSVRLRPPRKVKPEESDDER